MKSSGFQVTDEFMAQLPLQLIVPSSHLQLFESVGQGKHAEGRGFSITNLSSERKHEMKASNCSGLTHQTMLPHEIIANQAL